MIDIAEARRVIDNACGRRRSLRKAIELETKDLKRIEVEQARVADAKTIVDGITTVLQQRVHEQISRVVTQCLSAVFEDPYAFKIVFERKRDRTEARLTFFRDGVTFDDPLNEVGGGVIDIAALGLRLACILLVRPKARRLVVVDEPFSNVRGAANRARTRDMLVRLAEELDIQFVLNTDVPEFRLGTVIELPC